jgi:alpha-beta hydrolase superfamily lysophospholipase
MATIPSSFLTNDKLTLKIRSWDVENPRAVICLIHGFGEHSGRYDHVAKFFNEQNIAVAAFDLRGHGESEGKRGHAPSFKSYLDDIYAFTKIIFLAYPRKPLILYGHSMGGNLVLNFLIKNDPLMFSGLIATGPWIRLAFEPKPILITLGKMMRKIYPSFTQPSGLIVEHLSKDPEVVKANINDPLINTSITASAGMGLTEAAAFLNTFKGLLVIPSLIMHGSEDLITSQPASEEFAKRVKGVVTYKKWDGMYHEIHNEPDKLLVFNAIMEWIDYVT